MCVSVTEINMPSPRRLSVKLPSSIKLKADCIPFFFIINNDKLLGMNNSLYYIIKYIHEPFTHVVLMFLWIGMVSLTT